MTSETPFRLVLAAILLATSGVAVHFRIRAGADGEAVSRREEGLITFITLRLAGLGLMIATLAYLVMPHSVEWASVSIPTPVRWMAMILGGLSSLLMAWTLACLGKNLTDTVVTREEATLVTSGPYRWVRHPYYTVAGLLMLSAFLVSANGLIGALGLVVLGLLVARTSKEEEMLVQKFGQQYLDYKKRTPAFVPLYLQTDEGAEK